MTGLGVGARFPCHGTGANCARLNCPSDEWVKSNLWGNDVEVLETAVLQGDSDNSSTWLYVVWHKHVTTHLLY